MSARRLTFPQKVIAISDTITILQRLQNNMPDKSWMLYLLEAFDSTGIAVELNLISQFDGKDNFWAIFNGINQYRFTKVLPYVGHTYLRQIIMNKKKKSIEFLLLDQTIRQLEKFELGVNASFFSFEAKNQFSGIEWWNKSGNLPFDIRYTVELSYLLYSQDNNYLQDLELTYMPYLALLANSDNAASHYPVSFQDAMLRQNCICYKIGHGKCSSGFGYGSI